MLSTNASAMSLDINLDPPLQDHEPTIYSPRPTSATARTPRGSPVDEEKQAGSHQLGASTSPSNSNINSSSPTVPRRRSSLSFNNLQTDSSPLNTYHSGYGCGHAEEPVEQPRTTLSPIRLATASSFTSYLPASIRARISPEQLPQRMQQYFVENDQDDMGLTGEGRKTRKELAESQTLGSETMSQPPKAVSEGCPSPETTPKRLVRISAAGPADSAPKSAGPATAPSRLSLLTMFSRPPPALTAEMHDELLSMNVEEALFPPGTPASKDAFSPAAFKNLQTQATGLLTKMQNAYRQKAQALADVEKEREADRDELEEAETRAKHLKFQLEDMASKAAEQERRMKQIMEELAAERRARAELERFNPKGMQRLAPSPGGFQSEAGSTISEDLGVDEEELQKRKWRKSNGTDTSFETDDDSMSYAESESVFSRPRSPSVSTTTTTRGIETSSVVDMPIPTPQSMRGPSANNSNKRTSVASVASTNRRSTQQMSTFQKLMKGISGDGIDGCRNCKGQDASVAWDTVGLLRDENKQLKHRVGELEDCLEGALDAVNGIGL
ncbi:hypothetical protein N0V93_004812 [Gnomoniopsis smithogilvyi]|uniref:Uncharacterized protein n=1 Tax=Gnomoniopsis smithogilvyi TaxID=1191159 RepID=A0A9W8YUD4_9PEZI|nr:hypothetical protein N0V93_004812 [Gnomoniopsis smithogilvyi]